MRSHQINKVVDDSINEINEGFFLDLKIETSPESEILGLIDSMQVVALLVALEEKIEEYFNEQIELVDDIDMLREGGPLQTVGALKDYLNKKLFQATQSK
jgi:hypothetical protein